MLKSVISIALAGSALLIPAAAQAQAIPGAVVAIVDTEKVTAECTACKAANAALTSQVNALKAQQQALAAPLQTEGKALQAAVDALNGKQPDAALQARIKAFQTRQQQAAGQLQAQEAQIQRNQAYIVQQVQAKLAPIYQQVMQRRGATVLLDIGSTLASSSKLDVTADILAALNAAMPSVATTAPAQQQQPQGR